MTDTKFYASFSFGQPKLAKFAVKKETEKSFMPDHTKIEYLIGRAYIGFRLGKDRHHIFDNLAEALGYLLDKCESHLKHLEESRCELEEQTNAIRRAYLTASSMGGIDK